MHATNRILERLEAGCGVGTEDLLPLLYEELKSLASSKLKREVNHRSISATVLVHEAYMKLVGNEDLGWETRGHFFAAASEAMRRILVDRARKKKALRRGGDRNRQDFDEITLAVPPPTQDLLALDEALDRLAIHDKRKAELVKLRFFGGLTGDEVAKALGVSAATAERDWKYARVWLHREIVGEE
jgi:RNA polymerase sigma factor (TIGR02999 family)